MPNERERKKEREREREGEREGWGLAERSERCAGLQKIDSNPSQGSVLTFRFDFLLTARGSSM
jgi:hypothetical protein